MDRPVETILVELHALRSSTSVLIAAIACVLSTVDTGTSVWLLRVILVVMGFGVRHRGGVGRVRLRHLVTAQDFSAPTGARGAFPACGALRREPGV